MKDYEKVVCDSTKRIARSLDHVCEIVWSSAPHHLARALTQEQISALDGTLNAHDHAIHSFAKNVFSVERLDVENLSGLHTQLFSKFHVGQMGWLRFWKTDSR